MAYRARFQRDFLIDLVGYRRYGHNEGDEPWFTQPLIYGRSRRHPTVRERLARVLADRGTISAAWAAELNQNYLNELQSVLESLKPEQDFVEPIPAPAPPAAARKARTAVPLEALHGPQCGGAGRARRLHRPSQAREAAGTARAGLRRPRCADD